MLPERTTYVPGTKGMHVRWRQDADGWLHFQGIRREGRGWVDVPDSSARVLLVPRSDDFVVEASQLGAKLAMAVLVNEGVARVTNRVIVRLGTIASGAQEDLPI